MKIKVNHIYDDDLTALVNVRQRLRSDEPLLLSEQHALGDILGDLIGTIATLEAEVDLGAYGEK